LRFSTRSEYGIRVLVRLGQAYGSGPLPLSEIAEREDLPLAYLEHIAAVLRREGLVLSRLGARGGYVLSRPPDQIGMAEVLGILEGPLAVGCPAEKDGECSLEQPCSAHALWSRVKASLSQALESTTLIDLVHASASSPPPPAATKPV